MSKAAVLEAPVEEYDDIDPADWLQDAATVVGRYTLPNGKSIKLASITDGEESQVRESSKKVNPKDPRGRRLLNMTLYKRNMIAFSVNKANGKGLGDTGHVRPEDLAARPVGELTAILKRVMELSGLLDEESEKTDPETFFD